MSVGWLQMQINAEQQRKKLETVSSFAINNKDDLVNFTGVLSLPQTEDTLEAVATVILHAPPDMGSFEPKYVGSRVSKMIANKAAYDFLQELKTNREKKQAETLTQVPADGTKSV